MLEFRTQGFNGYGVKYSPFFDSRIAVSAAANFGLVGNGRLYILGLTPNGIVAEKWYDTQDCLFDTAWSEAHENQIVVASGDGAVKLFDLNLDNFPVQSWHEHKREVFSVHWNLTSKDTFCSSSWDGTVKIWNPTRPASILTLPTNSCTYSASWSPHSPFLLSCVSSDSHLRVFDVRAPTVSGTTNHLVSATSIHNAPAVSNTPYACTIDGPGSLLPPIPPTVPRLANGTFPPSECLTHDWNKYRDTIIATGGVDRLIRTFDLRMPSQGPLAVLPGHGYAIRKLAWSPHLPDVLLSASYDMTCRVWTDGIGLGVGGPGVSMGKTSEVVQGPAREMGRMARHTEFVTGVDWCLFGAEGWCASCGWDERLLVWDVRAIMG
ncbi:peroxin 7 [Xylona heveae TC161]|uniref:Peroxin-7 n=1 Tax=Xylona heveae (strain CBS 132557 / TC161) TaxID=1328760 RepID=A0A165ILS2_XYLHT|nr:peroxin 7 [Xylona heveae TC161]KZF25080.1 peroxin 7 [Xylona heveae TC161]